MKHFLICLMALSLQAFAGTTGRIAGVVRDSTGDPIAGATVMISGTEFGTMTDSNGEYLIHNLSPGEYTLLARMVGKPGRPSRGSCVR